MRSWSQVARFGGAAWRPLRVNWSGGRWATVNLVVIHQFAGGTVAGVERFLSNPARQASYHFGVGRNGEIRQWVDTRNTAWHGGPVNARSIGIGHEALNTPMTQAQLNATARIIRWARGAHRAIPAGRAGIGWHRQFMATACPGDPIIRQIPELARRASGAAPPPPPPPPPPLEDEDMFLIDWTTSTDPVPVVIPNRHARGRSRLRLGCNQAITVRVDFAGAGGGADLRLSYERRAQGRAIPRGATFVVLRNPNRTTGRQVAVTFSP
jgi:hypothetical protein